VIPPAFVHDLLARVDIVEIVGRHVELRKAGATHKGLCPFHGEKTPSFTVSAVRQTYHCFGCGVHGNAIGFLMEHSGIGFVDAVRDLAQQAGMAVPEDDASPEARAQAAKQRERQTTLTETLARAAAFYRAQLKSSERSIAYLKGRGLSGEIAARFGLGYAPDGWRSLASAFSRYDDPLLEESGLVLAQGDCEETRKRYDRFRDRVMFPIRSVQGEVIGFGGRVLDAGEPKYLNSPETPVFSKGRELYGLYEARQALRQHGFALVVEGYMDVVALAQLGFPNAVATLGTACTADHVQKLFRFTDSVVFSFDGDAAGRRAAGRALEAALPLASDTRSVRFLFLPAEHDPDSFVREHGPEAFQRRIDEATPLSRHLIEVAQESCDLLEPEGRARFLALAKPLWDALPQGALRHQLLAEIGRVGQLQTQELAALWGETSARRPTSAVRQEASLHRGDQLPTERSFKAKAPRTPRGRQRPADPPMQALRMLLLHSDWWDLLSMDDHELLHQLEAPHGELCAWLERFIADHGAAPWASIEAALTQHLLHDAALTAMQSMAVDDAVTFSDLRRVVDLLWIDDLNRRSDALAARAPTDPASLTEFRAVRARIDALRRAIATHSETASSGQL
jgi:DNA primase